MFYADLDETKTHSTTELVECYINLMIFIWLCVKQPERSELTIESIIMLYLWIWFEFYTISFVPLNNFRAFLVESESFVYIFFASSCFFFPHNFESMQMFEIFCSSNLWTYVLLFWLRHQDLWCPSWMLSLCRLIDWILSSFRLSNLNCFDRFR